MHQLQIEARRYMAVLKVGLTPQPAVAPAPSGVVRSTSESTLKSQFWFESVLAVITQGFSRQLADVLVALLTPAGIEGGLIHIANHAFSKITLFFCAGAIYVVTHKKNISEMSGLGRAMPLTFGAFALASLSMIGAPPVAGFVTKWYLVNGAWDAGSIGIIIVLLISTLLNAAYFAPVVYQGFFGKQSEADVKHNYTEAHPAMVIPLAITAVISVLIGLYPAFFMRFVQHLFT